MFGETEPDAQCTQEQSLSPGVAAQLLGSCLDRLDRLADLPEPPPRGMALEPNGEGLWSSARCRRTQSWNFGMDAHLLGSGLLRLRRDRLRERERVSQRERERDRLTPPLDRSGAILMRTAEEPEELSLGPVWVIFVLAPMARSS